MTGLGDAAFALLESHSRQLDLACECIKALVTRIERLELMLKLAEVQKVEAKAKPKKRKK